MRQTRSNVMVEQKPLGILDAVTAGFEVVRRRPWTLLIPVVLDIAAWLAPRLSLAPIFRPAADQFLLLTLDSTQDPVAADEMRRGLIEFVNSLNLLGLVSSALASVAHLPSLLSTVAGQVGSPVSGFAAPVPLEWASATLLFIALFVFGLLGAAAFLELIAAGVRPLGQGAQRSFARRVLTLWLRLIGLSLLLAACLLLGVLALMTSQAFGPASDGQSFVTALVTVGLFWLVVYFFFAVSAMTVSSLGVLRAIGRSALLVRQQFWAALGFVMLVIFLERGLALIWEGLTVNQWLVLPAIVGHAFIGTGLTAATMVFYQDRMNWLERIQRTIVTRPK